MATATFTIEGLRELQLALRQIHTGLPRVLRLLLNHAARHVVEQARRNAQTPLERKAAESVRAVSQQLAVQVRLGGARVPFALGAEFGAYRDLHGHQVPSGAAPRVRRSSKGTSVKFIGFRQFKPWTGNQNMAGALDEPGYFFYPAIRSEADQVQEDALALLDQLLEQAGFSG